MKNNNQSHNSHISMDDDTMLATVQTGVSIDVLNAKLTKGEIALLGLMSEKIKANSVIVIDEIVSIYTKNVRTRNWVRSYNTDPWTGKSKMQISKQTKAETTQYAKQWLQKSIGNLVLKAKLVAIPVIDV